MIQKLYYNYKDIIKSPRIAIGPQRLFIATIGVVLAHMVYVITQYISASIDGIGISRVWFKFGLFPSPFYIHEHLGASLIATGGIILAAFITLVFNTALSRSVYMYLRNNFYYTSKQSMRFAFSKSKSIVSVYLTFLFLILPFILGSIVMSLLGRISGIGVILNALATLPYIFAGMILVFMVLCLVLSIFLAPAIIATSEEDGFGTAVQCMHLTWGQPWRLTVYSLLTVFLFIFGIIGFAFVIKVGLIIYSILFMPLMHSLAPILDNALHLVQESLGGIDYLIKESIGESASKILYLKKEYAPIELITGKTIASNIVYISLMLAGYMTIGYGQGIINSSLTMSYIIFEKKLTGKILIERKDSEIEEDQDAFEFNTKSNTKSINETPS